MKVKPDMFMFVQSILVQDIDSNMLKHLICLQRSPCYVHIVGTDVCFNVVLCSRNQEQLCYSDKLCLKRIILHKYNQGGKGGQT